MDTKMEIEQLAREIRELLSKLDTTFWEVHVEDRDMVNGTDRHDNIEWLFHGTRRLYYKICLFLELRGLNAYLEMFRSRYANAVYDRDDSLQGSMLRYSEYEPSMIILEEFRDFLSVFPDVRSREREKSTDRLRMILDNTRSILTQTNTQPENEAKVYNAVRWFIDVVYPSTRHGGSTRFQKKFTNYKPDILIPELQSAVEYKYVRSGKSFGTYLDQLKTDADSYTGDPDYKYFYAVVYFENSGELSPHGFNHGVTEKQFPDNWTVIAV
ncbi:MAG: hypothetical protein P0Y53_01450 [Candidatus Pseudobacter hemicellulosilyticus]|uniref:Uncharacterized protein n=1 Tax=Candidatus Pseudobacter hemicellulosilyticus TaxID=3121375 RepID=A0AAJ6BGF9_9BACT|nr:MAG: hypothetical protein P0Y53_01450 [Pseudobacter sp.]